MLYKIHLVVFINKWKNIEIMGVVELRRFTLTLFKIRAQPWYPPHFTSLPENSGPTGRQFKTKLELKQWFHWAHQPTNQRRQALRGTIGSKSCERPTPLSAPWEALKGGLASHNFSAQWSH